MNIKIVYCIKEIRNKQKLTTRQLAEKAGVSHSTISDIENGIKHPTVYTLCLIAVALKVSPYELFKMENI